MLSLGDSIVYGPQFEKNRNLELKKNGTGAMNLREGSSVAGRTEENHSSLFLANPSLDINFLNHQENHKTLIPEPNFPVDCHHHI